MIDNNEKISKLVEYLNDCEFTIGEKEIDSIKFALNILHTVNSTDIPVLFKKLDDIDSSMSDLSYTLMNLMRYRARLNYEYKNSKDAMFTSLTRKGRPSTVAIESEIRLTNPVVGEYEWKLESLDGIIEYFNQIKIGLERAIWNIKSRISYSKM